MQRDSLSYYEQKSPGRPISIISIPTELGSDARGLSDTPSYLRAHGLMRMLESLDVDIAAQIDIACPAAPAPSMGRLKNLQHVADVTRASAAAAAAAARETVLAIGGDHSMSIGTIAGASRAHGKLGVIYIDAHPDAMTDETSLTGNIHGMVSALVRGIGHPSLASSMPVAAENFLYIGLKDFDRAELELLRGDGCPYFTMLDIARSGLDRVFSSIDALARGVERVWVSMDIDSIDRAWAPGVAMQNDSGLTRREALAIAQYIGHAVDLAGLDIVEMLPKNDVGGKTAKLALELIAKFLGGDWSSYSEYMDTYEKINIPGEIKEARG